MKKTICSALITAAFCMSAPALAADTADTLITARQMLDVRTGKMIANPQILVRDGRIISVKQNASASTDSKLQKIDLAGMTLVPGLIDMHVHLDTDPTYGGYSSLQYNDRFWSMLNVPHASRTLEAGFTTVRTLGSDAWNDIGLRQAIEEGKVPGPRIVAAAYSFGATGGHCDSTFFPPFYEPTKSV